MRGSQVVLTIYMENLKLLFENQMVWAILFEQL